jgi:hypothetical protein
MKVFIPLEFKLLLALASITTLLVFPIFTDPVNLPKFIFLMSSAFSLAYYAGDLKQLKEQSILSNGLIQSIKKQPLTFSLLLFVIGVFASSVFSPSPLTGIFGLPGRRNGFLTYLALFLVFLVAQKFSSKTSLLHYLQAFAFVGSIQATYMIIQYLGLDPLPWDVVYENRMFGTLGNPNFSSAFLAMSLPAMLYCAVSKHNSRRIRYYFRISVAMSFVAITLAGVYQGPLSLAISGALTLIVWAKFSAISSKLKYFLFTIFAVAISSVFLGVLKIGPLSAVFTKSTFELRLRGYWPIAAEIGFSNPIVGVGQEQFVNYFPKTFGPEYRVEFGQVLTDNAHNYPLHFFAEGGFAVFLPYIAFITLMSFLIYKFCSNTLSEEKPLSLTIFAIWVAFIGQMMVSVDNLGLSIWIWILAGLIVGVSKQTEEKLVKTDLKIRNESGHKSRSFKKSKHQNAKHSLVSSTLIFLIFIQLALLDNKVWLIESARKQGSTVSITEADLDTLHKRSKFWPIDPTLLSRTSSLLLSYGREDIGFSMINRAISINPDSPSLINLQAIATETIVNRTFAVPMRAREIELDPWNEASSIEYIKDLLEQNSLNSAKNEFNRLQTFASREAIEMAAKLLAPGEAN